MDQGCFKNKIMSVGNTNHEVKVVGDICKKKDPKYTTKKIIVFIAMSFKTMFACLN
jgi:hypothetical protein